MADADKNPKQPKVTRVTAKDDTKKVVKKSKAAAAAPAQTSSRSRRSKLGAVGRMFSGFIGYFKGAWFELRQVRWPNRRATWGMTGALLGFTAFFVAFILIIDVAFEYLFKLILR